MKSKNHFSPIKGSQKTKIQEICNVYTNRKANILKKKFIIEKENFNSNIVQISKKKKSKEQKVIKNQILLNFLDLPAFIHVNISLFLIPKEIIASMQYVNKYLYNLSNEQNFWKLLSKINDLNVNEKYLKQKCIAERRSKGKIFKGINRITKKKVIFFLK